MKTPMAQEEFERFNSINGGKPVHGTFYFHYARLIEALAVDVEEMQELIFNEQESFPRISAPMADGTMQKALAVLKRRGEHCSIIIKQMKPVN